MRALDLIEMEIEKEAGRRDLSGGSLCDKLQVKVSVRFEEEWIISFQPTSDMSKQQIV